MHYNIPLTLILYTLKDSQWLKQGIINSALPVNIIQNFCTQPVFFDLATFTTLAMFREPGLKLVKEYDVIFSLF